MKNKSLIIAALLAVSVSVFGQKTLTILHTNDTHSCIMPLSENLADTLQAGRGGFLPRICYFLTVVISRRARHITHCSKVMWKWV